MEIILTTIAAAANAAAGAEYLHKRPHIWSDLKGIIKPATVEEKQADAIEEMVLFLTKQGWESKVFHTVSIDDPIVVTSGTLVLEAKSVGKEWLLTISEGVCSVSTQCRLNQKNIQKLADKVKEFYDPSK